MVSSSVTTAAILGVLVFADVSVAFTSRSSFTGNARHVASQEELNTELRCPPSTSGRRHAMSMPPFLKKSMPPFLKKLGLKKPGSDKEEENTSSSVATIEKSDDMDVESAFQADEKTEAVVDDQCVIPEEETETQKLMRQVKEAGTAGVVSYALWELGFWTLSVPVCIVGYNQVTGHWPDLSNSDDQAKLGAEAFAFVNFARFAVPLRIGLALSTTPWIQENIIDRFKKDETPVCEPEE